MYSRPKPTETEEDILKLQEEFLKQRRQNSVILAAKIVKQNPDEPKPQVPQQSVVINTQTQLENTFESIPTNTNIGKIVEKSVLSCSAPQPSFVYRKGFPQAKRRDPTISGSKKGSIFSQQMKRLKTNPEVPDTNLSNAETLIFKEGQKMDTSNLTIKQNQPVDVSTVYSSSTACPENTSTIESKTYDDSCFTRHKNKEENLNENITISRPVDTLSSCKKNIPNRSYIITGNENEEIHNQNVEILEQMTEQEILAEHEKLLGTMDPAIVAFLKGKREKGNKSKTVSIAQQNKAAENVKVEDVESSREVITHPNSEKWLNFNTVETGKLAWMTNIDIPKCEKSQAYEASFEHFFLTCRFDFAGWLLPYTEAQIDEKNRSLYHHGEEPGRPGYTLQELFQLCRSSMNQQKIVALNTIANILALYQSGVYDGIIEIPFEQIFFVLRFCLDDNTRAVLNASIKAVRNLFFYIIDEVCLDNLLGFGLGMVQPIVAVDNTEMDDDNAVNDQQLAETNLVKCLIRTDILKRIRYIINTVQPSTETIVYCLEILIRLARDSDFIVKQIFNCENLLESIAQRFGPKTVKIDNLQSAYGCPLQQAIKLFRILSTRSKTIAGKLINRYKILDSVASYLSSEELSLNSNGLKLQIESLHLWCVFIHYGLELEYFRQLEPILWRMLNFHVRNTNIQSTSYVVQGHISVLLNLLTEAAEQNCCNISVFIPLINSFAFTKWLTQFGALEEFSCGKLQIVAALLRCCLSLCKYEPAKLDKYALDETILRLLVSSGFNVTTCNIKIGSNLLSSFEAHKSGPNLKSVEAAIWNAVDHIVPIIHSHSCLPFLNILAAVIQNCHSPQTKLNFLKHKNINSYLTSLNKTHSFNLVNNWFTRLESQLIANMLKIAVAVQKDVDTSLFYETAVKCLSIFNSEQKQEIEFVLTNIVFSPSFYPCETFMSNLNISENNELLKHGLDKLNDIFSVYVQVLNIKTEEQSNLSVESTNGNVMPIDWIYSPIILLYSNQQQNKSNLSEEQQTFIVTNCLRWIYIYEQYFPNLAKLINPTDRFCRIACTFLSSDTLFLNSEIHDLLEACLRHILASNEKNINFSKPIHGLNNFQDFYTQLLEQYQGVSYGDALFGNFILLPLIQRHDVKYRKVLWSEYAGVVQIFNVTPEQVLCPIELFLSPPETDISLLKCYRQALVMGVVRKQSFLYQIAMHHVEVFIKKNSEKK